ncbi:ROK family protein [Amphibacillus cookii]|uniref:ROK family protein n=1 Tax=Amphibacillus cookii TaxID=767787 RepID=UPI00195BE87B|nr:ROK family protein [Amphibacillus cookii]MBM7542822.1 fructokinase [Amphibacillus cookii]
MLGGIEAGGTKFIGAVCDNELSIIDRVEIPTTTPNETFKHLFDFFDKYQLNSLGIGSFGPIGINKNKADYGYLLSTPKKGWANFDFLGEIKKRYSVPYVWTTDVNAAAYAEIKRGAAKGKKSCIYLTVGTGIGGGAVFKDQLLQGFNHPEMGHIFVKRHESDDYWGCCPYHKDCLEGLASGSSLIGRTGKLGEMIDKHDPIWDKQAYYLAQALVNYAMVLSPEIIVLGGGVMKQNHMIGRIRKEFDRLLNGYVTLPSTEEYIVPWSLSGESGIVGALLLAQNEFEQTK